MPVFGAVRDRFNASPFSYRSEKARLVVSARIGISLARAIYADAAVNQLPGYRTSPVVVEKPFYSFDLHLAGKHHLGLRKLSHK